MKYDKALVRFRERVVRNWLRDFCEARAKDFQPEGFVESSLDRLEGFDAYWFQSALDEELVKMSGGFFSFPQSGAKEQIFWSGRNGSEVRDTYLWAEPVITIGACARLIKEFGWPSELVGAQSEYPWPFDLVCKSGKPQKYQIVGEVKKNVREIDKLIELMNSFFGVSDLDEKVLNSVQKNAYRKVKGLNQFKPAIFWALGPNDYSFVFRVVFNDSDLAVGMEPVDQRSLLYQTE